MDKSFINPSTSGNSDKNSVSEQRPLAHKKQGSVNAPFKKIGVAPAKHIEADASTYEELMKIFTKTQKIEVTDKQRTELILKGNKIFNEGDIEKARIIFSALQYYDGMVRVARHYYKSGKILEAYATFLQANASKETEKIAADIAQEISAMMKS